MSNAAAPKQLSDAPLTLVTLGGAGLFAPSDPGHEAPLLEMGKPLALITYVACSPGRTARRDHLQDLLWADLDTDGGRHALRQTLWYLRRRISQPVLAATGDSVSLAAPLLVDRDAVLRAADDRNLDRLVTLYTGDFLPAFAAPGGAEFERWAELERARLRALFCRASESLVRQWLSEGKARQAVQLAKRVRDQDELHEPSWRLLLEALMASNDPLGAQIEADRLAQLLAQEEQEPEPATVSMLKAARAPATVTSEAGEAAPGLVAALVGREREFKEILSAWDRIRAGRSAHIHVVASAGLGKTRLLNDVRARLRTLRARVVLVRGSVGQRDLNYAMAGELVAALAELPGARGVSPGSASALVAMNPALSSTFSVAADLSHSSEARRRRLLATRELLQAIADETPVAVLIDDVHWGDADSRAMIRSLADTLDVPRLLLVTTARPVAEGIVAGLHSTSLTLEPLTQDAVAAMITSVASLPQRAWSTEFVSAIALSSRGSPLLVLETLQLLIDRSLIALQGESWTSDDPASMLAIVREGSALQNRILALDATGRSAMLALAAAGMPIPAELLALALACDKEKVLATLTRLEQRGIVQRASDVWLPAHDELAASSLELSSKEEVGSVHRALGRAIMDSAGKDTVRLRQAAHLLLQANDWRGIETLFGRLVRLLRRLGDRRSNTTLASSLLGETADATLARRLVRSLSLPYRTGLYTGTRVVSTLAAALAFVIAGSALIAAMRRAEEPPDAELAILRITSDTTSVGSRVLLRRDAWVPGEPITVDTHRTPDWRFPGLVATWARSMRPGTNHVVLPTSRGRLRRAGRVRVAARWPVCTLHLFPGRRGRARLVARRAAVPAGDCALGHARTHGPRDLRLAGQSREAAYRGRGQGRLTRLEPGRDAHRFRAPARG